MRYPEFLKKGGRVGFIAPSFGCTTEPYRTRFNAALSFFEAHGYTAVTGPNCFRDDGVGKSSTPENCADEINDFFLNDRCDIIISCGGGETMCEDLEHVDFDGIASGAPKWFMGYSDNTNLVFPLTTICDTAAVYGPNAAAFGTVPVHESIRDALSLLSGDKLSFTNYEKWEKEGYPDDAPLTASYNCTEPFSMKVFVPESGGLSESSKVAFSGRLLGGCLDCLSALCGTRFDKTADFCEKYKEDGIIWFMEACDLNPMGIRRALWQLKNAGWFQYVRGFIFGRAYRYDDDFCGMNRINAAAGILSQYGVPVVMDVDLGHLPPMMPFISGAQADVVCVDGRFTISYRPEWK